MWLDQIALGLTLWEGPFEEDVPRLWLRWCDQNGKVMLTGAARAAQAEHQLEQERQQADPLAELLPESHRPSTRGEGTRCGLMLQVAICMGSEYGKEHRNRDKSR